MLDQTLDMFKEGGRSAVSPAQGSSLIDGWIEALQGDPNVESIKQALTELNQILHAAQPDRDRIRDLMVGMAKQAEELAQGPNAEGTWTGKLERLAKILSDFGQHL